MTWRVLIVVALCSGCGLTLDFEPDDVDAGTDGGPSDARVDSAAADTGSDASGDAGCPCDAPLTCHPDGGCGEPCDRVVCRPGWECSDDDVCVEPCATAGCDGDDVCLDDVMCGPCRNNSDCGPERICEESRCILPSCTMPSDCEPDAGECERWNCTEGECTYPPRPLGVPCADGRSECDGDGECLPHCGDGEIDLRSEACDTGPEGGDGCTASCEIGCVNDSDCFDPESCRTGECDLETARCAFTADRPECTDCVEGTLILASDFDRDGFISCEDEACSPGDGLCDCNDRLAIANPAAALAVLRMCMLPVTPVRCGEDADGDFAYALAGLASPGGECREGTTRLDPGDDLDCNDEQDAVFPAQGRFMSVAIDRVDDARVDFDYNCDGVETRRYRQRFTGCAEDCRGANSGWLTYRTPECGEMAAFVTCSGGGPGGECEITRGSKTQTCL